MYGLELGENERYIYFFDTPELELFETGIIARARRIIGSAHDSTIKFRPIVPDSVPAVWRKYSGFKIEADASEKGVVKSASLTMPVAKGLIKRVAAEMCIRDRRSAVSGPSRDGACGEIHGVVLGPAVPLPGGVSRPE